MRELKLGSLFDGSGGFPLAGSLFGIRPVWASEIEPFPIRVTKLRFPEMKHLGSVTDVNGAEIEPVDIITFGSPCQDLSVAGKRAGIHEGQRSNLFFEAIRIIKEMRDATAGNFPRFAVWENVPGAFSSNKGADFAAVLEALCGVKEPGISVSRPEGGWKPAGLIVGDGYSIAWRVYDAQYWGVPQRRKRIYLIADFGSERAGEILFESESLPGDSETGGETGEETAADAERSAGRSDFPCIPINTMVATRWNVDDGRTCKGYGKDGDPQFTLQSAHEHAVCYSIGSMNSKGMLSDNPYAGYHETDKSRTICADGNNPASYQGGDVILERNIGAFMGGQGAKARSIAYCDDGTTPTLKAATSGSNMVPDVVYALEGNGARPSHGGRGWSDGGVSYTLNTIEQHAVVYAPEGNHCGTGGDAALIVLNDQGGAVMDVSDKAGTLRAQEHGHQPVVCYGIENHAAGGQVRLQKPEEPCQTLTSRMGTGGGNVPMILEPVSIGNGQLCQMSMKPIANTLDTMHDQRAVLMEGKPPRKYIVRRLTPTECGRLQGFPDGWCDGANGSDSAIYKMWGNGIALPCAADVLGRVAKELRRTNE